MLFSVLHIVIQAHKESASLIGALVLLGALAMWTLLGLYGAVKLVAAMRAAIGPPHDEL